MQQKNSNFTEINNEGYESSGNRDVSMAGLQIELLQKLADRVVHDAEEIASRIRKEAELEATRLIEDANRMAQGIVDKAQKQAEAAAAAEEKARVILQEAKQKAAAIETDATSDVIQTRAKIREDIKKNLLEVVTKIHNELQPSLDYLVARAKSLEREIKTTVEREDDEAVFEQVEPELTVSDFETSGEQQEGLKSDTRLGENTESIELTQEHIEVVKDDVTTEMAAELLTPEQNSPDLLEGKVEIEIAPPVNMSELIEIIRYLADTLDAKVLKTSGSWNSGITITIILDKPLTLVSLLKEVPKVKEVNLIEDRGQSSGLEQSDVKKISIVMGNNTA